MMKLEKICFFLFAENFHKKQEKSGWWTTRWSHAWHGRGEGKDLLDVGDDVNGNNDDGDDEDTSKTFILGPQQNEKCMVSTGITFGVNTDVVADPILISAGDSIGG